MSKEAPGSEFSHVVELDRVGPDGLTLTLTANPAARKALAKRYGILAVDSFTADLRLQPDMAVKGQYLLKGQLEAEVEQTCVVSLEPVRQRISDAFVRRFAPAAARAASAEPLDDEAEWLDPDAEDPADPIQNGQVDVGDVAAEELALALDPYPRKPEAGLPEGYRPEPEAVVAKVSPFAALAKLKAEKKD